MRKLISGIAVIVIVSSALAFKTKPLGGLYCGSTTANVGCHIISLKKETTGASNFFINTGWGGCTCPSTDCPTAIRLVDQN